jgi:hypothetical protein
MQLIDALVTLANKTAEISSASQNVYMSREALFHLARLIEKDLGHDIYGPSAIKGFEFAGVRFRPEP